MNRPCDTCGGALDGRCYVRSGNQPETMEFVVDGMWINQVTLKGKDLALPQHSHKFEHLSAITRGSVRVICEGMPDREFTATDVPAMVRIPANAKHLFITLSDEVTILCLHRIDRTGAVEIAEEHHIVE